MHQLRINDPSAHLLELYQQWKGLTEREGAAILASNWAEVRSCQEKKQKLQPQIIKISDQLKNASRGASQFQDRIRECVNELIQLETRNSANLAGRLQTAKEKIDSLDCTSSRLRQLHKSYVPAQGSAWNQYS
jgi:hypothetical protein